MLNSAARCLLVEDDANDVEMLSLAFTRLGWADRLVSVSNGQEAVEYLEGKDKYADRAKYPLPTLIILDIKMPRMNGFEFMSWLRAHASLNPLPVLVLTSSQDPKDIERAKALSVVSYLVKPGGFQKVLECSRLIVAISQAISEGRPFSRSFPSGT